VYDLSIIIPGANEEFLGRTIEDLLANTGPRTEIITVIDGPLPNPPLKAHPRVTLIYHSNMIGQRAATNEGVRISKAKYVMKIDAHCAVDKDFDTKMLRLMEDDVTMIPVMRNLHVFDWVCDKGHRRYQGDSGPCEECGGATHKEVVWIPKKNPQSIAFRFDTDMHFQYWNDLGRKQSGDLTETMSIQGSCFMATREKYLELDLCSEEFHGWGQQGVEVACKTWLSGGRVLVNRTTWYAHMFRTKSGDFGFPYPNPHSHVVENREKSKELFMRDKWPGATQKFQWLIDKFNPPGWKPESMTKGIIYYTDSELDEKIARPVREQLQTISKEKGIPITSSSLKKLDFGQKNVRFPSLKRGYLTMFKQIVGALENCKADIVYFCEHDVLYHPSHFDFTPTDTKTFYYNQNVWMLRLPDGHGLHYDVNQLSGLCVFRDTAIVHFRERYEMAKAEFERLNDETEFNRFVRNMGFEPMTHNRVKWENQFKYETWKSSLPNVDIKHGANATGQRWRKDQYRNQQLLINWIEGEEIPGWGRGVDIAARFS